MPNDTMPDQDTLTDEQRTLTDNSRAPTLTGLDDAALLALIGNLKTAIAQAAADKQPAVKTLRVSLRRVQTERRKRNLALPPAPAADADTTSAPSPLPAKAPKVAKRAPATPARKPAGRKKSEARKPDLRTGSRRVAKAGANPAAATDEKPALLPQSMTTAKIKPGPMPAPVTDEPETAQAPVAGTDADGGTAMTKADRKAAKEAEKEARKAARKAERKAAKLAEKAQKKADKVALKAAEKAARKAEAKAAGSKGSGKGKKASRPGKA